MMPKLPGSMSQGVNIR